MEVSAFPPPLTAFVQLCPVSEWLAFWSDVRPAANFQVHLVLRSHPASIASDFQVLGSITTSFLIWLNICESLQWRKRRARSSETIVADKLIKEVHRAILISYMVLDVQPESQTCCQLAQRKERTV